VFNFGAGTTRLLAAFIGLIATVATIAVASGGSSSGTKLPPPPPPEPSGGPVLTVVPVEPTGFPRTLAKALAAGCFVNVLAA
jgi:hypothetical protein